MSVTYRGNIEFEDKFEPFASKSEFGMDVLTRVMKGGVTKLPQFLAGLRQGNPFGIYTLQTWSVDQSPNFPEVTLIYKGLIGGIPNPIQTDSMSLQTITVSTETPVKATRDIQYEAGTTNTKYIVNSRPRIAIQGVSPGIVDPIIRSSVIRTEDGKIYFGVAPIGLVIALTPVIENRAISRSASPVVGTPYFECDEVWSRMYKDQNA